MATRPIRNLDDYPRPWFYRPEIYYAFFIFPPVWSILTLRSPWHGGGGFFGILVGGVAWFMIIASVVLSVRWVQEGGVVNLFIFVPGLLLTVVTQVQWTAHRAQHGPPPTEEEDTQEPTPAVAATVTKRDEPGDTAEGARQDEATPPRGSYAPRRRRRRRRSINRSSDTDSLC